MSDNNPTQNETQTNPNGHAGNVILHLSDLHFGYDEDEQALSKRTKALDQLIDVVNSDSDWRPHIICITGDIAMKASPNDYKQAKIWIEKLAQTLDIKPQNIIFCPGNHDVDRNIAEGYPPVLETKVADRILSIKHFEKNAVPFKNYKKFCKEMSIPPFSISKKISYLTGYRDVNSIRFISLNSAWFSQRNKNDGKYIDKNKLWIGLGLLDCMGKKGEFPIISKSSKRQITVVLFHHPFEMLHEDEINERPPRDNPKEYIALRSHIILTGHDHGIPSRPDQPSSCAHHFRGGATYCNPIYYNAFHLLKLKEDTFEDKAYIYCPSSSDYAWKLHYKNTLELPYWDLISDKKTQRIKEVKRQIEESIASIETNIKDSNYGNAKEKASNLIIIFKEALSESQREEVNEYRLKYGKIITSNWLYLPIELRGEFKDIYNRISIL